MPSREFGTSNTPHILLIEAPLVQPITLKPFLESQGYKVTHVRSDQEALAFHTTYHPDLLICDISALDGRWLQFCHDLRQVPGSDATLRLGVLARFNEGQVEDAYRAGITDYLVSPISLPVLRQRVDYLIRAQQNKHLARLLIRAVKASHSGVCITNAQQADNPIIYVNPAFERMTGYRAVEVIGRNCRFLQGVGTDKTEVALVRQAIEDKKSVKVELLNYRKDGDSFWNELSLDPIYDESGQLSNFVGIQQDVTQRRTLQEQLRQANVEWERTVDTVEELIFLTDTQGKIVRCNRAGSERLKTPITDLMGQKVYPLLFPHGEVEAIFDSGMPQTVYLSRLDGWFTITRYFLGDEANPYGIVYSLADVTRRLPPERHAMQAERLASLGRLAAVMAHEIKNPLQAIQLQLELVMQYPVTDAERERYLQRTCQEIDRLREMTQRVLAFARPSPLSYEVTAISEVLQQTVALVQKQVQLHQLQLTLDLMDCAPIRMVVDQIRQVFLNLVLNAIEATPKGGKILLSVKMEEEEVVVRFINQGPVIPSDQLPQIFDPYFTTKEHGGGIGLSISHTIVAAHGGTLSAENLPNGAGVCFVVRLPC